jgi:hypothetical protein
LRANQASSFHHHSLTIHRELLLYISLYGTSLVSGVTPRRSANTHKLVSKPNWAYSSCGMYSSRRWSVERHILNLHNGISNVVPFVDYLVGRKSGFYLPKFRISKGLAVQITPSFLHSSNIVFDLQQT